MNYRVLLSWILISLMATGCAPSLGKNLRVDTFPAVIEPRSVERIRGEAKVRVEKFIDSRRDPSIAEIDGRKLMPQGDPGLSVQRIMERHLKANGIILSIFGTTTTLSGAITQWHVTVTPGFPTTTIDAVAEIVIDVADSSNRKIYTGKYSGMTSIKHPFPNQSKAEELLGEAMSHAVGEAMADQDLIDRLYREASFR